MIQSIFILGFLIMKLSLLFYKDVLEEDAKVMKQWRNGESKDNHAEMKSGKLPLLEKFS